MLRSVLFILLCLGALGGCSSTPRDHRPEAMQSWQEARDTLCQNLNLYGVADLQPVHGVWGIPRDRYWKNQAPQLLESKQGLREWGSSVGVVYEHNEYLIKWVVNGEDEGFHPMSGGVFEGVPDGYTHFCGERPWVEGASNESWVFGFARSGDWLLVVWRTSQMAGEVKPRLEGYEVLRFDPRGWKAGGFFEPTEMDGPLCRSTLVKVGFPPKEIHP